MGHRVETTACNIYLAEAQILPQLAAFCEGDGQAHGQDCRDYNQLEVTIRDCRKHLILDSYISSVEEDRNGKTLQRSIIKKSKNN